MEVLHLNKESFESEVLHGQGKVLVDFWAPWCSPCRMLAPVIEEVASEVAGDVKIAKVNVDEERELAETYSVFSIPTLLVFENGKVVQQAVGFRPKDQILDLLK